MSSTFRRSHSQVWWSTYWSDHRSTITNNIVENDRNSSRSQDSGFSDSDSSSSSPPHTSKEISSNAPSSTCECPTPSAPNAHQNWTMKPCTQLELYPDPRWWHNPEVNWEEREENLDDHSVSSYLAGCYYQLKRAELVRSTHFSPYRPESLSCTPSSNRTCFIVDEIPKLTPPPTNVLLEKGSTNGGQCQSNNSTVDTSSSSSFDDSCGLRSMDDTVKFVEKPQLDEMRYEEQEVKAEILEPEHKLDVLYGKECSTDNVPSNRKGEEDESLVSNLDLSHLPDPTFTSTPKKKSTTIPKKGILRKSRNCLPSNIGMSPESNNNVPIFYGHIIKWLEELKSWDLPQEECTRMVQCKPIDSQNNHCRPQMNSSDISKLQSLVPCVQSFQEKTQLIYTIFTLLRRKLDECDSGGSSVSLIQQLTTHLCSHVKKFILNYSQLLPQMNWMDRQDALTIIDSCDNLQELVNARMMSPESAHHMLTCQHIAKHVTLLEPIFTTYVSSVLVQQVKALFSALHRPNSDITMLNILQGISNLDLIASGAQDIIIRLDGIQRLLEISWKSNLPRVRKAALRALEIVCQNSSTINQFGMVKGVEILSEMLTDAYRDESELCEVISVLIQVTAPWTEDNPLICDLLPYLDAIINAITHVISSSNSCETLLLCSAALANIISIEDQAAILLLVKLNTAGCLLTAVRRLGTKATVFLLEQVAIVVADMAAYHDTQAVLAKNRVVGALLSFLHIKHTIFETEAEIAAAERLQYKSAIALSRLCTSSEVCCQVVELQGVCQLAHLCKEEKERNFNDSILVACLTSLRKIRAHCGTDSIIPLSAKELVEPRLVDSFLKYSSKKESYV